MTAQTLNVSVASQSNVAQSQSDDLTSFSVWTVSISVLIITSFAVWSFFGAPSFFMFIGASALVLCAVALGSSSAPVAKAQSTTSIVSSAVAPSIANSSESSSADEIVSFFNDLQAFDWNFEDKYKFQADRKLFFKNKFKGLVARATSPMLAKILNDFRAHHYDSAAKPVVSSYL